MNVFIRHASCWLAAISVVVAASCGGGKTDPGPECNGPCGDPAAPVRPFYVTAHNPNTIAQARAAVEGGANALEPDVNVYADGSGTMCISHVEGASGAPTIQEYLTDLHALAIEHPELSLVVFDCKPAMVSPANGMLLLDQIRQYLTYDTNINVILSVSEFSSIALFDEIASKLGPREGVMIDEENDPIAVTERLEALSATHVGFGNGISVLNGNLGPNVRPSMERASALRAATGLPDFIYVWTVDDEALQREYMRIGVDGVIADDVPALRARLDEPEFSGRLRLATRADNPFEPVNAAYSLTLYTGDRTNASTDAKLTFTLTGSRGTASITVDSSFANRQDRNTLNYVTLPSGNLGWLSSISVRSDLAGVDPSWFLNSVALDSFRYDVSKRANCYTWIENDSEYVFDLENP